MIGTNPDPKQYVCGLPTASGAPCKRETSNPNGCPQHRRTRPLAPPDERPKAPAVVYDAGPRLA